MNGLKIEDLRLQIVAALALCLLTTGCVGYGNVTRNLSQDGAIVVAEIGSPWGVQKITRIGATSNTVLVEKDGRVIINPNGPPERLLTSPPTNAPRMMFVPVMSGGGTVTNAAAQVGSPGSQYGSETNASRSASPHEQAAK
jgi:hypothetical protein